MAVATYDPLGPDRSAAVVGPFPTTLPEMQSMMNAPRRAYRSRGREREWAKCHTASRVIYLSDFFRAGQQPKRIVRLELTYLISKAFVALLIGCYQHQDAIRQ